MRVLSTLLVSFAFASLLVAAPPDSAVYVQLDETDGFSAGSGTCIACENGKSLILTAAHVAWEGKGKLKIILKGKEYAAKYLDGSPIKEVEEKGKKTLQIDGPDLALLVVDASLPTVQIAEEALKEGDDVRTFGFPGARWKTGPYPKIGKVVNDQEVWATADARRGDSGCGLFNTKDQLAGVVHSRSVDADEPGMMATPLSEIKKFLKEKAVGFPQLLKSLK